jgi:hypothetical protein
LLNNIVYWKLLGMRPLVKKNPSLFKVLFLTENLIKIIVERIDQKKINRKGSLIGRPQLYRPYHISKIHRVTEDTLDDSIDFIEDENSKLKEKIK